jgi:single-stranded-DNA-specific exonuclease
VADVAPLVGENRTIAWLGLNGLADPRNRGLRALIRRLGMLGRPLRAVDIGFRIGPRINAAGRLASAETAIDLFAAENDDVAWQLCAELDRMNAERQAIELEVREAAEEQVPGPGSRVFVLASENWHKGVLGLTAGRVAQKYHRPTLVISTDGEQAVGSARSIPTIDLHSQLESIGDVFSHFGGHEFACGFALSASRVPELRERLEKKFDELDASLFQRDAHIDARLRLGEVTADFVGAHEMLQPFGAGNPQPLFLAANVNVVSRRAFGEDCCELTLEDPSGQASAVLWPSASALNGVLASGSRADVLFQIEPGPRLTLVDARNSLDS